MSDFDKRYQTLRGWVHSDRGPLDTYEIQWKSGHVERIQAHQVLLPVPELLFSDKKQDANVKIHGEIDGKWKLILIAPADDILTIRLITHEEKVPSNE